MSTTQIVPMYIRFGEMRVVLLVLFLCLEPQLVSAQQVAVMKNVSINPDFQYDASDAAVARNLQSILEAAPSLKVDLPELNAALERQYKPFGQFKKDFLDNNSLLQSKELKAVLASPIMNTICIKLAPFLRDVLSKHYADHEVVPKTVSRMNELLGETDMIQMIASTEGGNMTDHVSTLLSVTAEASSPSQSQLQSGEEYWRGQGVTTFIHFRDFWRQNVLVSVGATQLCIDACPSATSSIQTPVGVENFADVIEEFHKELQSTDQSVFSFSKDQQTCFSTFGHVSCCQQPWLAERCDGCAQCQAEFVPPTECEEVRELISSCLFTQFTTCATKHSDQIKKIKQCEDDPAGLNIECPVGHEIDFQTFQYGRSSITEMSSCHRELRTDQLCQGNAAEHLKIVADLCNKKSKCTINDALFKDPCPGVSKYLEGEYLCKQKGSKSIAKSLSVDQLKSHEFLFPTDSASCLCESSLCDWTRVREICRLNTDCPFCSTGTSGKDENIFSQNFWISRACSSSTFSEFHISPGMWAGLAMLILGFVIFQLHNKKGEKVTMISKMDFEKLFSGRKTVSSKTLSSVTRMDEYFARALIRKITGKQAEMIGTGELFTFLDADHDGFLGVEELTDGLYRSLRREEAEKKAEHLIRVASGSIPAEATEELESSRSHGKRQLTVTSTGKSIPYKAKWQSTAARREKVPSGRHLKRLA